MVMVAGGEIYDEGGGKDREGLWQLDEDGLAGEVVCGYSLQWEVVIAP